MYQYQYSSQFPYGITPELVTVFFGLALLGVNALILIFLCSPRRKKRIDSFLPEPLPDWVEDGFEVGADMREKLKKNQRMLEKTGSMMIYGTCVMFFLINSYYAAKYLLYNSVHTWTGALYEFAMVANCFLLYRAFIQAHPNVKLTMAMYIILGDIYLFCGGVFLGQKDWNNGIFAVLIGLMIAFLYRKLAQTQRQHETYKARTQHHLNIKINLTDKQSS